MVAVHHADIERRDEPGKKERISVVLSDRLRKLTEGGILDKVAYQQRPVRHEYRLTSMGRDLYPVIVHLAQWGDQYLADDHGAPLTRIHKQCEHTLQAQLHCSHCGETVAAQDIRVEENTGFEGKILQARVQDTAG